MQLCRGGVVRTDSSPTSAQPWGLLSSSHAPWARGDQPLRQSQGAVHHLSYSWPGWAALVQTPHSQVGGSILNLGREGQYLFPALGGHCKERCSSDTRGNTGMTQMAQQEGDVVGSAAPAAWGQLYGFYPGPACPRGSVLLRTGWLSDADMDKE